MSTTTTTPALELSGIDLHYGFVRALDQIDFRSGRARSSRCWATTAPASRRLLKVLSGAHQPTVGTIRVHGEETRSTRRATPPQAGIQMVYQDLALVDAQDIATNLNIGREILRKGPLGWLGFVDHKAQRSRSEAELDQLGVRTAAMTRPVEMLSGGQRQVVALARSATRVSGERKGVLLLDEPTAALGYEQTQQVQALIRRMAEQGIAIVLVTHDLPLAVAVSRPDRGAQPRPQGRRHRHRPDRQRPARRLDHRRPRVDVRVELSTDDPPRGRWRCPARAAGRCPRG